MNDLDRCAHGRYRIDHCLGCGRSYVDGELTGPLVAADKPCMCGTDFTCMATEHDEWVYELQRRVIDVLERCGYHVPRSEQ